MEVNKLWNLGSDRDRHVILNGVQSAENQIEDADSIPQLLRELLYHDGKTARRRQKLST